MSDESLSSYQSADTAWRYKAQLWRAQNAVQELEAQLGEAKAKVAHLEAHPPLFDCFNWSA